MTTEAQEVTTVDELQLRFVGGVALTPQGSYAERGRPMTTEAQEVMTVDELQLRFVGGGVVGGPLTLRGRTLRGDAPDNHWSTGSDDRGRASTSFCWRRRSCWRTFDPQWSYAERGRLMTTEAQVVTTVDELQLRFVGGGVVGGPLTLGRTLRGDAR